MILLPRPRKTLDDWAANSQQKARRNAMIASTGLAQRRAERLDVEEYLARTAPAARRAPASGEVHADSAQA